MNPEVTASASTMETSSVKGGIGCKVRHGGDCTNVLQKEVAVQALKKERNPLAQEHQSRDASLGVLRETVLWPTRSPLSPERTRLIWHVSVQTEEGVRWKHLIEARVRNWSCRVSSVAGQCQSIQSEGVGLGIIAFESSFSNPRSLHLRGLERGLAVTVCWATSGETLYAGPQFGSARPIRRAPASGQALYSRSQFG